MTLHWSDDEPTRRHSSNGRLGSGSGGGITLAQSKAAMLSDTPGNPLVPPVTATVVITLLFGVLGVIPALMHSDKARSLGESGSKYWVAFAAVLVGWLLVVAVFLT